MKQLEAHFKQFRPHIIGNTTTFVTPFGEKKLIYADWIASGRLYAPIEDKIRNVFGPFVGNTHSEASETGTSMTLAYHLAQQIIKQHVNANEDDIIITSGTGMTGVVNKFQRILGLKIPERAEEFCDEMKLCDENRPVVFVTHIEHHSNHTSWLETIADVVVVPPDENMLVSVENLEKEVKKYADRDLKIGSFSACSNVTGLQTPIHELAKVMHQHGGFCFADYAASAPYVEIDMHPADPEKRLDAIFFSPHKFLGGPGSSGVLIFNRELYRNQTPDNPGGGTVRWTNAWGEYSYLDDIEAREDGGTPGFIQAFRTALSIELKQQMGCENIHHRENRLIAKTFEAFEKIDQLHILADNVRERIGVFSFYVDGVHHNLIVKLLNDLYGIQVRGGCSCAGTYGHYLLHVDILQSKKITQLIDQGDLTLKPGWIRLSLHPTMTNDELDYVLDAIKEVIQNAGKWQDQYEYCSETGEFFHKTFPRKTRKDFKKWFQL